MDTGLREHPDLFREYFGNIIPQNDNKFAALNRAVWTGGSFIYVPQGVKVELPLQAYFRINAKDMGQFERTLIIVDEGARCTTSRAARRPPLHGFAAFGGGGDHRQARRPLPLHDYRELVQQRLQPRHQARHRVRERAMEWVDANRGSS